MNDRELPSDQQLEEILAQARIGAIDRDALTFEGYGWDLIAARAVWAAAVGTTTVPSVTVPPRISA